MSYHKKHTKNNIAKSIQNGNKPVSSIVFWFPAHGNHVSHSGMCSLYILFTSLNFFRLMILACLKKPYACMHSKWHIIWNFHYRITDNSNNVDCNRLIPKIRLYFKIYKYINRCVWSIWAKYVHSISIGLSKWTFYKICKYFLNSAY